MPFDMLVVSVVYVLLWQGYQLRRRVSRFAQIALLAHLIGSLLVTAVAHAGSAGAFGNADPAVSPLVSTCVLILSTMALYLFRLAVDGHGPTSRRAVVTIVVGLAMLGSMLSLAATSIADGAPMIGNGAFSHFRGAAYFAVCGFYFAGTRALVVTWMIRRSRTAGRDLRIGIRIAALGLLISGGISLVRAVPPAIALFGGDWAGTAPDKVLLSYAAFFGNPLGLAGLSYPLVMSRIRALLAWRQHRGAFGRIEPLWALARDAFPEVVLPADDERQRRAPLSYRLRRRRAECLDALYYLRAEQQGASQRRTRIGSEDAISQLRAAIAGFERDRLGGDQLWDLVDQHRNDPDTDVAAPRDHDLLEQLADTVENQQAAAPSRA